MSYRRSSGTMIGGILWVPSACSLVLFESAFVKKNFSVVVIVIVLILLLPAVIEYLETSGRDERKDAPDSSGRAAPI